MFTNLGLPSDCFKQDLKASNFFHNSRIFSSSVGKWCCSAILSVFKSLVLTRFFESDDNDRFSCKTGNLKLENLRKYETNIDHNNAETPLHQLLIVDSMTNEYTENTRENSEQCFHLLHFNLSLLYRQLHLTVNTIYVSVI
jgi:hypothetical protein